MRIGEIARQADLQTSAIRYYERIGILPKATRENGQRIYDENVIDILEVIKIARGLGYSLEEIKPLLDAFLTGDQPSEVCRVLARKKLEELDQLIKRAVEMKQILSQGLECGCEDPKGCFLHSC